MENQQGTTSGDQNEGFLGRLLKCVHQKKAQDRSPSIQNVLPQLLDKLSNCGSSIPKELPHLPDELLVQILRCLDTYSLKDARLTCRRWAKAGAHSLFRCIYFAPRTNIMDIFSTITENPVFALNITEMVYDSRIFQSHMLVPEVYYKAFKKNFPSGHPSLDKPNSKWRGFVTGLRISKYARSQQRYASLLQEQDAIFEAKRDFAALCAGMTRLPNLRRLSVLDYFALQFDCDTLVRVDHLWYHDWSRPAFEGIAQPARWTAARMNDYDDIQENLKKYPWDFRGVDNVLKAALLHAPNLRELLIGCQNSALSAEIYGRPGSADTVRELVPRLSLLKIDTSRKMLKDRRTDSVAHILQSAHHLEELLLSTAFELQSLAKNWSRLRVLDLAHEYVNSADFEAVVHSCAGTLRELRLFNLHLYDRAWEDCSRDLGPLLQLQFVAISAMTDEVASAINQETFSFIKLHQCQNTARNFMSNVSQSDIGLVSTETHRCQVVAWHIGEFVIGSRINSASRQWN